MQPSAPLIEGEIVDQEKIAYLVDDSMVKNVDANKLSKAFKEKPTRERKWKIYMPK